MSRNQTLTSLWHHKPFMGLWAGQTTSQIGSALTVLVLPLLAIEELGAGPGEIGILRASAAVAALVAAVPSGVLVDRVRKRPVMIVCDLVMAVSLLSVPVLAFAGVLTMPYLYLVAFVNGVFTLIFGIAYHAYVPSLVGKMRLGEANSKIAATESVARISGPALGATLASWIGIATTLLLDVVAYLVSAATTWFFTPAEPKPQRCEVESQRSLWAEARDGVKIVVANRVLAQLALTTIGSMTFFAMVDAVLLYFMVADLHVSTGLTGVVFGVGEVGGLLAAVFARRLMDKVGGARLMWLAVLVSPLAFLPALASPTQAVYLISVFGFTSSARFVLFDITQYVYRQTACPPETFGRMTATIRLGIAVAMALGALLGGFLGDTFGARTTLIIAAVVACGSSLPVLLSTQLRRIREIEDLPTVGPLGTSERRN